MLCRPRALQSRRIARPPASDQILNRIPMLDSESLLDDPVIIILARVGQRSSELSQGHVLDGTASNWRLQGKISHSPRQGKVIHPRE